MSLRRAPGLKRYETAWTWLHKLRRAMVKPGRDRLSGIIEVDETFIGGEEPGVRGRQTETKALVVVPGEVDGRGIGRIRMQRVPDASATSLLAFVEDVVERGSTVVTDGWGGYAELSNLGYTHEAKVLRGRGNRLRPNCCHESTGLFLISSGGYWELTRQLLHQGTWISILMNSTFTSIEGSPGAVESCSTAYSNKPFRWIRHHTGNSYGVPMPNPKFPVVTPR